MKKSRITKLALSGAAVAALAATFSTSTYAWYVSNKTASVNAVTGQSSAAAADDSITLSKDGSYGSFYNEIKLTNFTNTKLDPVVTNDGKIFYSLTEDATNKTAYSSDTAATIGVAGSANPSDPVGGKVYKFEFYVKSSVACWIKPTVTIHNTTAADAYTAQVNYTGNATYTAAALPLTAWAANTTYYTKDSNNVYTVVDQSSAPDSATQYYTAEGNTNKVTGVAAGQEFYVNALDAMSLSLYTSTTSANYASGYTFGTPSATLAGFQALTNNLNGERVKTVTDHAPSTPNPTGGAKEYYNAMSGLTLTNYSSNEPSGVTSSEVSVTSSYAPATPFDDIQLTANKPTKLEYYLWLDGADDLCYNCCAGQSFSIDFTYTVTSHQ